MLLNRMAQTLIWILILPVTGFAFDIDLKPRNALFRVGDRQELRCSVKDCPERFTISWGLLEDKPMYAKIHTTGSESLAIFDSVMPDHEDTILCKVSCGQKNKQLRAVVKVYAFPKDPVVSGQDHLLLGQKSTLKCEVLDAYPTEHLHIEWLQGETVLETHDGDADSESVLTTYTFTPTLEDTGKRITCRAKHGLEAVPSDEKIRETTVSLTVLYAPQMTLISEPAVLKVASNLTLLCLADGNPKPVIQWRSIKPDRQSFIVGESEELVVKDVTLFDAGEYECVASNSVGNQTARVDVIVLAPPTNVSILVSPASEIKDGEQLTVSCLSDSVSVGRMVLWRISENQKMELQSSIGSSTSFNLSSALLADSGVYECEATNEHGSQKVSTLVNIEAYPLEVELEPRVTTAERSSSLVLSCRASGCPQPAFFWRSPLDMPVHSHIHTQGPLSQLHLGPLGLLDERAYTCEAKCGSVIKTKHTEVRVFSFPSDPIIKNPGPLLEGEKAILHCSIDNIFPANHMRILWLDGDTELFSEVGKFSSDLQNITSTFSYLVGSEDQGKHLTCRVSLEIDGVPMSQRDRETVTVLELHYAPRSTSISVSPASEMKEGERVTVSCVSDSVPVGWMMLWRVSEDKETELQSSNGSSASFTISSSTLADSGIYQCQASNEYGNERASTNIRVKAPPRNTTVFVYPSTEVQEGQNVTVCCSSVSYPPPAVVLRKMSNGTELYSLDGTFLLVNLTPNDTGLYQVNVTNDLGYETEIFTINVMEKRSSSPPSFNDIVIPAICLCIMATTAGLVLDYLRRARRKGFYELAKCVPSTA